jgi:hypothetical protein
MTDFSPLESFLDAVPAVVRPFGSGLNPTGRWWIKFGIDIEHELAWHVVQEFGHVLNYVSIEERLPTVFKPVSPPPYMNGGPREFLAWVIECEDSNFSPANCAEWLAGRLPNPVADLTSWQTEVVN